MKKLLIVVDFQVDFVTGSLGFDGAASLERAIAQKIEQYREAGQDVAFTFDTHEESYLNTQEGRNLPVPHCIRGTPGWQLYGQVRELMREQDRRFEKPVFGSLTLANYLAESHYERVELVGLVSNICVVSNAVLAKAALPEAEVVVDAACTLGHNGRLHEAALDVLEGMQVKVVNR